ncbi:hypothetical protein Tcan_02968 [Toxocara canis]|uniref:Uncharacterized protein n=1 Tax=Toxocara canis TaxID=6265 RepID=A0A0B2VUN0_TOXCA|nr:hypothetical protein Tcan_02968 [Toxocara canis]
MSGLLSVTLRPVSERCLARILVVRMASSKQITPPSSKKQIEVNKDEGHFNYQRYWSRDSRFTAQAQGDTPARFMFRRLGHAYEVYPLIFLAGAWFCAFLLIVYVSVGKVEVWLDRSAWFCAFLLIVYVSVGKVEVWLDRSQEQAPWDWERIRDNYYKQHTVIFDVFGNTHQRLEIMEKLQDQMAEAAKQRGTR